MNLVAHLSTRERLLSDPHLTRIRLHAARQAVEVARETKEKADALQAIEGHWLRQQRIDYLAAERASIRADREYAAAVKHLKEMENGNG